MDLFSFGSSTAEESDDDIHKLDADADHIEFVCKEEDYGVIPEPKPANKVLPDWYKKLEGKLGKGLGQSTVKRCMPFLDAMTSGWILPLAAETEVKYEPERGEAEFSWEFSKSTISSHAPAQIGGEDHPHAGKGILKFHNYWGVKVPDGYSVLFLPPMNRVEPLFEVFSGMVDCDNYFNFINFPFIWTGGQYHDILDRGHPLIQAIPIKRDAMIGDAEVRAMTKDENKALNKTKGRLGTEESLYRDHQWEEKPASRNIPTSEEDDGGRPDWTK